MRKAAKAAQLDITGLQAEGIAQRIIGYRGKLAVAHVQGAADAGIDVLNQHIVADGEALGTAAAKNLKPELVADEIIKVRDAARAGYFTQADGEAADLKNQLENARRALKAAGQSYERVAELAKEAKDLYHRLGHDDFEEANLTNVVTVIDTFDHRSRALSLHGDHDQVIGDLTAAGGVMTQRGIQDLSRATIEEILMLMNPR